ncbi:peptidoglycan/LPS O-acetylase OafA/YrhL [Chitinivorax tropicus]|uniref:Peptidoglycan/LPS O-acetylase OafA/YrhL n=1 Tax=Chitinivorax tropicus TaxID=714531 RepID=A0A840MSP6_9PROT|nr:acyltransferase [Chitinivorax tropicus]MBB5020197.1 peptidoglycan/LPS O-acetylase OafA/YrhL [Chitinivorax tropicus]
MTQSSVLAAGKAPMVASLEAARGFAALYVTIAHLLQILGFKSGQGSMPLLVEMVGGYAHQAVLFFFLLSGFSIHYASLHRPLDTWQGVKAYLLLRVRRLYPIWLVVYALAVILIWIGVQRDIPRYQVWWAGISQWDWWANLLFLGDRGYVCGRLANALPSTAVWSLGYEVIYYLLYPVFWWSTRRFGIHRTLWAVGVTSGVAFWLNEQHCHHLWNVLELYIGWCLGAWIAHRQRVGLTFKLSGEAAFLVGMALLLVALAVGYTRFAALAELSWLGLFFILMAWHWADPTYRTPAGPRKAHLAMIMVLMAILVLALEQWRHFATSSSLFTGRVIVFTLGSLILLVWSGRPSAGTAMAQLTRWLLPLGGVSYAQYLLHLPLIQAGHAYGGPWGAIVALPITWLLAYWLEKQWQPQVNSRLPIHWPASAAR